MLESRTQLMADDEIGKLDLADMDTEEAPANWNPTEDHSNFMVLDRDENANA
jgi:hypothetical protein